MRPDLVIVLCSWEKHFPLTVPLSTLGYKWVLASGQRKLMKCRGGGRGVTLQWTNILSRGEW